MSEFIKKYKKWHAENNMKYDSATQYHKALQSRFGNWRSPSDFRKLQYELNNAEMMLGLKKVAVKNLLSEKRQLRQEVEKLKAGKELIVVPKFVDEYIKHCFSESIELCAVGCIAYKRIEEKRFSGAFDWIESHFEEFTRAWLGGYAVEKEKLYRVVLLKDERNDEWILFKNSKGHFVDYASNNDGFWQQHFTEREIKANDERYWPFAVPVDEVTE